MSPPAPILAEDDAFWQLIIMLALFALAGIGQLIKKIAEWYAEKQAEAQHHDRVLRGREAQPPAPEDADAASHRAQQEMQRARAEEQARQAAVEAARQAEQARRTRRRAEQQKRRRGQQLRRRRELVRPRPGESAAPSTTDVTEVRAVLGLDEPENARRAILYHEILAPPKALRDEPHV